MGRISEPEGEEDSGSDMELGSLTDNAKEMQRHERKNEATHRQLKIQEEEKKERNGREWREEERRKKEEKKQGQEKEGIEDGSKKKQEEEESKLKEEELRKLAVKTKGNAHVEQGKTSTSTETAKNEEKDEDIVINMSADKSVEVGNEGEKEVKIEPTL